MKDHEIMNGSIVNIDYIEEFTKERIRKGLALVLWCGLNGQPLVLYFSDLEKEIYRPCWESYENIESIRGHVKLHELINKGCGRMTNRKSEVEE